MFHIALALGFQSPRRANLLQIAIQIQIQLQQIARIIPRTPGLGRFGTFKPKLCHIQLAHERLDYAAHMIAWNQIIQRYRKQRLLPPRLALNEAHENALASARAFSHQLISESLSFVTDCHKATLFYCFEFPLPCPACWTEH
jgi:hypothetical protein